VILSWPWAHSRSTCCLTIKGLCVFLRWESSGARNDDETIVDPISVSVNFCVESVADQMPRLCAIAGVVPSISLRIPPSQLSRKVQVSNAWQSRVKQLFPNDEPSDNAAHDVTSSFAAVYGGDGIYATVCRIKF
jgi:hypothetical protein